MSIRQVFRVQCDWCKGWLSRSQDYVMGTDMLPRHYVVEPSAERALNWPGERAARLAAQESGWRCLHHAGRAYEWFCPDCGLNPLGIVLATEVTE